MRGIPFAELSSCRRRMHYGTFMAAIEREASVEENGRKMGIRCFETQLLNNRRRSAFNHHLSSLFLYVCVCVCDSSGRGWQRKSYGKGKRLKLDCEASFLPEMMIAIKALHVYVKLMPCLSAFYTMQVQAAGMVHQKQLMPFTQLYYQTKSLIAKQLLFYALSQRQSSSFDS